MNKVLVIDDDRKIRSTFCEILDFGGFSSLSAKNAKEAFKIHRDTSLSAILLDLEMPDMHGLDVLSEINSIKPGVPVIIVTGHGDVPYAVKATKLGAFDFICKPMDAEHLINTVRNAVKDKSLLPGSGIEDMLGSSEPIKSVLEDVRKVASSDLSVIIQGETGAGKSLVAQCIHRMSSRADKPFVKVDAGAIPETLIESELFGYQKGAFTGAVREKKGFFSMAEGGTIFIDELENISPYVQSKLLGAVEERKIYPLGGDSYSPIDVRVISASNSDLASCLSEGKLRRDLFYRLAEFVIKVPPLRERKDDIEGFARRFLAETAIDMAMPDLSISPDALMGLQQRQWPGNVRELKNVIKRAGLLANGGSIRPEHLGSPIDDNGKCSSLNEPLMPLKDSVKEHEKQTIIHALRLAGGDKNKTAMALRITPRSLYYKIKELNID